LLTLFSATALAVPSQFTHQGRMVDADGAAIEGSLEITFRLVTDETGGTIVWEEALAVELSNGFFAAVLGTDVLDNPLDAEVLDQAPLWLELQVTGAGPMYPRQSVNSVPYAAMAGVAEEVQGGPVDASQIAVSGSVVVDEDGQWVGPTPTVSWAELTDIPADFADGVDDLGMSCIDGDIARWDGTVGEWFCDLDQDTWLSEDEVRGFVSGTSIDLLTGSTMGGAAIATGAHTSALGWASIEDMPDAFADGEDADTLGATACGDGLVLVYSTSSGGWSCGTDTDTTLTAEEVQAMVEASAGLTLGAATTIGGVAPRLAGEAVDWSELSSIPDGIETDDDALGALVCAVGQIAVLEESGWACADLSDQFDADLDGVMVWNDCNDDDPGAGSSERDADCDGTETEFDCDDYDPSSTTVFTDADCDGTATADDCDDDDAAAYPGATEVCDGSDNDCDGDTDEGLAGSGMTCPAASCAAILSADPSADDGDHYILFDGTSKLLRCDMSGGGWTRLYANDFEDDDTTGWSYTTTSTCGSWSTVIGGYGLTSDTSFDIDIGTGGIGHGDVKLRMYYLFIDTWDGESGYAKIDGSTIWSSSRDGCSGSDICGRTDCGDTRHDIHETASHSAGSINLRVGSSLNQDPGDESFAVDDVAVWIK
jgi:hypothetical protein